MTCSCSATNRVVHMYINSIILRLKYCLYSVASDILYLTQTLKFLSVVYYIIILTMHERAGECILCYGRPNHLRTHLDVTSFSSM